MLHADLCKSRKKSCTMAQQGFKQPPMMIGGMVPPPMYRMSPATNNTRRTVHLLQIGLIVVGVIAALALAMIVFLFTNQSVTSRILEDGTIREVDVQDGAITASKLQVASVTNAKLAPDSVDTPELATSSVEEAQLAAAAVTTNKLGSESVTTDKIAAAAVTTAKLSTYVASVLLGMFTKTYTSLVVDIEML